MLERLTRWVGKYPKTIIAVILFLSSPRGALQTAISLLILGEDYSKLYRYFL